MCFSPSAVHDHPASAGARLIALYDDTVSTGGTCGRHLREHFYVNTNSRSARPVAVRRVPTTGCGKKIRRVVSRTGELCARAYSIRGWAHAFKRKRLRLDVWGCGAAMLQVGLHERELSLCPRAWPVSLAVALAVAEVGARAHRPNPRFAPCTIRPLACRGDVAASLGGRGRPCWSTGSLRSPRRAA